MSANGEVIKHSGEVYEFEKQTVVLPDAAPVSWLTQALRGGTQTIEPSCSGVPAIGNPNVSVIDNIPCQEANNLESAVSTIASSSTDTGILTISNEDSPAIFGANVTPRSQPIACPSYRSWSPTHFQSPPHTYDEVKGKRSATERSVFSLDK